MSPASRTRPLTPEQLKDLFALADQADSVELKVTIGEEQRQTAARLLGIDPLLAQIRQVWFFDTPALDLNQAGLVVRARRSQGDPPDSVVKLRPVVPNELSPELRRSKRFKVEVDAMPGGYVCSASFKGQGDRDRLPSVVAGDMPIRKLFGGRQRDFFSANAPAGITFEDLVPLGPIVVFKLKTRPDDAPARLTVEQWNFPNGSRIIELSTKCSPNKAPKVAVATRDYLADRGIEMLGPQAAKTKQALRYFAKPHLTA